MFASHIGLRQKLELERIAKEAALEAEKAAKKATEEKLKEKQQKLELKSLQALNKMKKNGEHREQIKEKPKKGGNGRQTVNIKQKEEKLTKKDEFGVGDVYSASVQGEAPANAASEAPANAASVQGEAPANAASVQGEAPASAASVQGEAPANAASVQGKKSNDNIGSNADSSSSSDLHIEQREDLCLSENSSVSNHIMSSTSGEVVASTFTSSLNKIDSGPNSYSNVSVSVVKDTSLDSDAIQKSSSLETSTSSPGHSPTCLSSRLVISQESASSRVTTGPAVDESTVVENPSEDHESRGKCFMNRDNTENTYNVQNAEKRQSNYYKNDNNEKKVSRKDKMAKEICIEKAVLDEKEIVVWKTPGCMEERLRLYQMRESISSKSAENNSSIQLENGNDMRLNELLSKTPGQLSQEEVDELKEHTFRLARNIDQIQSMSTSSSSSSMSQNDMDTEDALSTLCLKVMICCEKRKKDFGFDSLSSSGHAATKVSCDELIDSCDTSRRRLTDVLKILEASMMLSLGKNIVNWIGFNLFGNCLWRLQNTALEEHPEIAKANGIQLWSNFTSNEPKNHTMPTARNNLSNTAVAEFLKLYLLGYDLLSVNDAADLIAVLKIYK